MPERSEPHHSARPRAAPHFSPAFQPLAARPPFALRSPRPGAARPLRPAQPAAAASRSPTGLKSPLGEAAGRGTRPQTTAERRSARPFFQTNAPTKFTGRRSGAPKALPAVPRSAARSPAEFRSSPEPIAPRSVGGQRRAAHRVALRCIAAPRSPAPRPPSAQPAPLAAALLPGVVSAGSARLPARSSSSSGSSRSLPSPPPGRGGCRIPEPTPRYSDIHRAAPASRPGPRSAAGPPLFSSLLRPSRAAPSGLRSAGGRGRRRGRPPQPSLVTFRPLRSARSPAQPRQSPRAARPCSAPCRPARAPPPAPWPRGGARFAPPGAILPRSAVGALRGAGWWEDWNRPVWAVSNCDSPYLPGAPEPPIMFPAELFGCTALLLRSLPLNRGKETTNLQSREAISQLPFTHRLRGFQFSPQRA